MSESQSDRLNALFETLDAGDRATLIAFAEFLSQRAGATPGGPPGSEASLDTVAEAEPAEALPEPAPRPAKESVVAAIRRLTRCYPMLKRSKVFNETSQLMSQHVMEGRPAAEVIDDLEALFAEHYRRYREDNG